MAHLCGSRADDARAEVAREELLRERGGEGHADHLAHHAGEEVPCSVAGQRSTAGT